MDMKHFDDIIVDLKSEDIATYNKAIKRVDIFYASDFLLYLKEKESIDFAFRIAVDVASMLETN
jgi:hypothetical protein